MFLDIREDRMRERGIWKNIDNERGLLKIDTKGDASKI